MSGVWDSDIDEEGPGKSTVYVETRATLIMRVTGAKASRSSFTPKTQLLENHPRVVNRGTRRQLSVSVRMTILWSLVMTLASIPSRDILVRT